RREDALPERQRAAREARVVDERGRELPAGVERHPFALEEVERFLGDEVVLQDGRAAGRERDERDDDEAAREEHREAAPRTVLGREPEGVARDERLVDERLVRVHDALRLRRRARREKDDRGLVGARRIELAQSRGAVRRRGTEAPVVARAVRDLPRANERDARDEVARRRALGGSPVDAEGREAPLVVVAEEGGRVDEPADARVVERER